MKRDTFKEVVMPLIQEVEAEYGSVTLCPKDDKKLKRIHVLLGVSKGGRSRIDTEYIRKLAAERGESLGTISKKANKYEAWLAQTLRRKYTTDERIMEVAQALGISEKDVVMKEEVK